MNEVVVRGEVRISEASEHGGGRGSVSRATAKLRLTQ